MKAWVATFFPVTVLFAFAFVGASASVERLAVLAFAKPFVSAGFAGRGQIEYHASEAGTRGHPTVPGAICQSTDRDLLHPGAYKHLLSGS